mmetsp:Transcript_17367/g.41347  ORF Transcript_17367/g.41347 Transcript_17367/m.41347 type:complete len:106 (-) Transcript_17367:1210-1527(-)
MAFARACNAKYRFFCLSSMRFSRSSLRAICVGLVQIRQSEVDVWQRPETDRPLSDWDVGVARYTSAERMAANVATSPSVNPLAPLSTFGNGSCGTSRSLAFTRRR